MPLSPIDVLRRLQSNPGAELPDTDDNDPATLYGMLDARSSELEHNLANNTPAVQPPESVYGPKGPEGQGFGNRENHGMPTFTSGGNVADLKSFLTDMKPMQADQAAYGAADTANKAAINAGYGGPNEAIKGQDAAGNPSYTTAPSTSTPLQRQAVGGRQMDFAKSQVPLAVEQEKNRGALEQQTQNHRLMMGMRGLNPDGQSLTSTPPPPTAGGAPGPNHTPPAPVQGNTGMRGAMDFITGSGPVKYNGLTDMLGMAFDRQLSKVASTPYTPLVQENSFANLQQLSGMFPGVRGFGYLLPKLAEHQANIGKETPANSYNRMIELNHMLDDTERELNDPSNLVRMSPDGKMSLAAEPQMILRAKQAIAETRNQNKRAMDHLQQLKPGIGGPVDSVPAAPPAASTGVKMVMDPVTGEMRPK